MTYDQLQEEQDANELTKNQLKAQSEKETNTQFLLKLSQEILALAQRNEELVKQQLVLMREKLTDLEKPVAEPVKVTGTASLQKGKLKKPIEMSIEELRKEIESNNTRCEELEEQRKSPDINTQIEAEQEIRTLSNRTKRLCAQEISLLKHELATLKREKC
jgi:hypothetical protein